MSPPSPLVGEGGPGTPGPGEGGSTSMAEPSRKRHHLRNTKSLVRARSLRQSMTEAERLLWSKLRKRRFANFKFRRQVPLGPFIADFVCFEKSLIIELDGGQHTVQREYDSQRTSWLEAHGFRVIRIWNFELREEKDAVDELIWNRLHTGSRE